MGDLSQQELLQDFLVEVEDCVVGEGEPGGGDRQQQENLLVCLRGTRTRWELEVPEVLLCELSEHLLAGGVPGGPACRSGCGAWSLRPGIQPGAVAGDVLCEEGAETLGCRGGVSGRCVANRQCLLGWTMRGSM